MLARIANDDDTLTADELNYVLRANEPVELASPNTPSTAIPLSRAFSILFYVQCPPFRSTLSL